MKTDAGDEAGSASHLSSQGTAAVKYARLGLAVLPLWPVRIPKPCGRFAEECDCDDLPLCGCLLGADCRNIGKHPVSKLVPHGKDDASTDPTTVAEWWKRCPDMNVGVRVPDGYVVIDIDPRSGGDQNLLLLMETCDGYLPETRETFTGGGGWHLWYRYGGRATKGKLCAGVDVKSSTGYVVMPGSMHKSGTAYQWARDIPWDDVPSLPLWARELLDPPQAIVPSGRSSGAGKASGLIANMEKQDEGHVHNSLMYACRAARDEQWSQEDIDALAQAAIRSWHPWSDVQKVLRSYGLSVGGSS